MLLKDELTTDNNKLESDNLTHEKNYSELSNESHLKVNAEPEINDQTSKDLSNMECFLLKKDEPFKHSGQYFLKYFNSIMIIKNVRKYNCFILYSI